MVGKGSAWYRFCRAFVRFVVFPVLGGLKVTGSENVPKEGALIVAPVHFSYLDPPLAGSSILERPITFMAKEELFKNSILGNLIRSLGAFPIRRGAGDTEAIRIAIRLLEEGRAVLVFPEGTRGNGETLGEIRAGVTLLAKKTGATVLPIGINGTQRILPKGSSKLRRSHVRVVIGKPFTYASATASAEGGDPKLAFAAHIERVLLELCQEAGLALKTGSKSIAQASAEIPAPAPTTATAAPESVPDPQ